MPTSGGKDQINAQNEARELQQREIKQTILNQVAVILGTPELSLQLALHYSIALQAAFQRGDDAGVAVVFNPQEASQIKQAQQILREVITRNAPQRTSLNEAEVPGEIRRIIEAFATITTTLQQQQLYRDRAEAEHAVKQFITQQMEEQRSRKTGLAQFVSILGENLLHELDQVFPVATEETEDRQQDTSQVPPHLYERINTLLEKINRLYGFLNHDREDARQTARDQLNNAVKILQRIQKNLELYQRRVNDDTSIPVPEQATRLEQIEAALDRITQAVDETARRIERSNQVLTEQNELREFQEWNDREEIRSLRNAIQAVFTAVQLDGAGINIAPHSRNPGALTTADLQGAVNDLTALRDRARAANLLDRSRFGQRTAEEVLRLVGDDENSGRYGEAQEHLRKAIELSNQEPKEIAARKEIDRLWKIIFSNYQAAINGPESQVTKAAQEILEKHAQYLSDKERKMIEITFKLRDAMFVGSGRDASRHLAWESNKEARQTVMKYDVTMEDLRTILNYGRLSYEDASGTVHAVDLTAVFDTIHDEYFAGPFEYAPGKFWDYAGQGNPTTKTREETNPPVPTIMELVEQDFPEIKQFPAFVKDTVFFMLFIAEPRMDQFITRYLCYQGSPIPGFDAEDADSAAPLAGVGYKAQSGGSFPVHRLLAMITRFPESLNGYADGEKVLHDKYLGEGADAGAWRKFMATWNKYLTAMNPYFNSVEVHEVTYPDNKKPHNMDILISVRNRFLYENFPAGFPYVQAHPDMKIRPTLWDIAKGKWRGADIPVMSYFDYTTLSENVRAFENYVDAEFKQIHSEHEVDTAVSGLVDSIKVFKALIFYLEDIESADRKRREARAADTGMDPEPSKKLNQLVSIVQLMSLVYLKRLYVKYKESEEKKFQESKRGEQKYSKERFKTTLSKFSTIVLHVLMEAGTLPGPILTGGDFPLQPILERMQGKTGFGLALNKWSVIFEDDEFVESGKAKRKFETFWPTEFTHIYESWMREPKLKDKDPNE